MKLAQYLVDYYDSGAKRFAAGQQYPLDDITRSHVDHGHAVEVEAADETSEPEPEKAEPEKRKKA